MLGLVVQLPPMQLLPPLPQLLHKAAAGVSGGSPFIGI